MTSSTDPASAAFDPVATSVRFGNADVFSIDVEEWFQVGAFENTLDRDDWPTLVSRVEHQTYTLLDLLAKKSVAATFFCLGWVAERHPLLVSAIHAAGHEVACHGSNHQRLFRMDREAIVQDIGSAKAKLEDAIGAEVVGYRAPSFSLTPAVWYVYELLEDMGFRYSSSLYPVKTDHYGLPDAPRGPFWPIGKDRVLEIPLSVYHVLGKSVPASGGGYFRLLPYPVGKGLLHGSRRQTGMPSVFYMHPWEIDPEQPYVEKAPLLSRFRHYTGQSKMLEKVARLLDAGTWGRMRDVYLPPVGKDRETKS